jgi:hypothetical protein
MSVPLPGSIITAVEHSFLRRQQSEALRLLAEYRCADAGMRERVLHCVVSLAGHDVRRLTYFLECAREDYRNLILWHEHAEQSRRQFFSQNQPEQPSA